jgi:GrpB-like predicted nucleotidyltransferase (UPF0157 family)
VTATRNVGMMVRAPGPEELPPWATAAAVIVPYDPGWTARARQFAGELTATLGPWLLRPVEHVGSTAIPGLTAKPVIDLMALVKSKDETAAAAGAALAERSWQHVPPEADDRPWRQSFVRVSDDGQRRLAHLHLMSAGAARWDEQLRFRDGLRASAGLRDEYASVKTRLAADFGSDRERYTAAKADFIRQTLATLS